MRRRGVSVLVTIATTAHAACARPEPPSVPFGFSPASGASHLALEATFLGLPDPIRIRDTHRLLTLQPHPAGSARDRELADWIAQEFRGAGLEDVQITAHPGERLVPFPEGARYPGFIFARGETAPVVETALREAHQRLTFVIE